MYTNKHVSLHTHYMYKTQITTAGRWVGKVDGAYIKFIKYIKCIALTKSNMYINKHVSFYTQYI